MADAVKQRPRCGGEVPRLEALFTEFITKRAWIKYVAKIPRALRLLQPNMSFKRKQLADAVQVVGKTKSWFAGDPVLLREWTLESVGRLQLLLRHVSQAPHRRMVPKWYKALEFERPLGPQDENEEGEEEDEMMKKTMRLKK
eukprot:2390201-Amphidinium_carterae.1